MTAPFTFYDTMVKCGVNDTDQFDDHTQKQCIAFDMFDNDFITCIHKFRDDIDEELKSYSVLTVENG